MDDKQRRLQVLAERCRLEARGRFGSGRTEQGRATRYPNNKTGFLFLALRHYVAGCWETIQAYQYEELPQDLTLLKAGLKEAWGLVAGIGWRGETAHRTRPQHNYQFALVP